MAGISSVNSEADFGGVKTTALRSLSIAGRSFSLVDTTHLQQLVKSQLKGQRNNATISVVALDSPAWTLGGEEDLTIKAGTVTIALKTCILVEQSVDAGIDAAVEFSFTFEQIDGETAE